MLSPELYHERLKLYDSSHFLNNPLISKNVLLVNHVNIRNHQLAITNIYAEKYHFIHLDLFFTSRLFQICWNQSLIIHSYLLNLNIFRKKVSVK